MTNVKLSPELRHYAETNRAIWRLIQLLGDPMERQSMVDAISSTIVDLRVLGSTINSLDQVDFEPGQPIKQGDRIGVVSYPAFSREKEVSVKFNQDYPPEICDRDSLTKILSPIPSDSECQQAISTLATFRARVGDENKEDFDTSVLDALKHYDEWCDAELGESSTSKWNEFVDFIQEYETQDNPNGFDRETAEKMAGILLDRCETDYIDSQVIDSVYRELEHGRNSATS